MIKIRRGLNLPITGAPRQAIEEGPTVRSVALVGFDYHGMKPTMNVKEGDRVKCGQLLFTDKKTEGIRYTSPACGIVSAIHRGAKRVLQSVVIEIDGDDSESFASYPSAELKDLEREKVVDNLLESGLWTALRTRPFSKVPALDSRPAAIFVSAMDTSPLAADPVVVVDAQQEAFKDGLAVLSRLTDGKVYVCHDASSQLPAAQLPNVVYETFSGVHPAGNVGTQMHFLSPVSLTKVNWTVSYQDVIAIGKLFTEGKLYTDRVISLAGPSVEDPRLVRTRLGACLDELVAGQIVPGDNRVVSGSLFGGRTASGPVAYLGRYHSQVVVLPEGRDRPMFHYLRAGKDRFSVLPIYLSRLLGGKKFSFTTTTNGSERAMVPVGAYEKVVPMDILPTQLLRALIVGDTETAQNLGCLELDEEDLGLCTYVCPGKYEYGPILRDNLTRIEKEG